MEAKIQQYVTDVWDPTVRDTTPETVTDGDTILSTADNEVANIRKNKSIDLALDVVGFSGTTIMVCLTIVERGQKKYNYKQVTYDILPKMWHLQDI